MRETILLELRSLREKHDSEVRKLVSNAAHVGVRSEDIARALGISRATLWRRYGSNLTRRGPPDRSAAA